MNGYFGDAELAESWFKEGAQVRNGKADKFAVVKRSPRWGTDSGMPCGDGRQLKKLLDEIETNRCTCGAEKYVAERLMSEWERVQAAREPGPADDIQSMPHHPDDCRDPKGHCILDSASQPRRRAAVPASSESLREAIEELDRGASKTYDGKSREWVWLDEVLAALASAPSPVQAAYRVGPCTCCESAEMWEVFCGDRPLRWSSSDKELVESVCELLKAERETQPKHDISLK